jgi:RNA polymerase sigma-70 factor (ECF subfamily)
MPLTDPSEFDRAYAEHSRSVHAAAYRVLGDRERAQDVVQDVFLRLWRRPQRYDACRGELGSYLRLMARSRAIDVLREGQAQGRASDRLQRAAERREDPADERPDLAVPLAHERETVRSAVQRLPAPQREAVSLAYWGGLTTGEIAERSGVPLGTAKSRVRLGVARLREECSEALAPAA